jgi:hypothetical protein
MFVYEAKAIVGGLSNPSKMPGYGYGLSALDCNIGTLLRAAIGSTCEKCYAMRGRYVFPNVKAAHQRRLESLNDSRWVEAMSFLINWYGCGETRGRVNIPVFRWHDSGDIQSIEHLRKIVLVAMATPTVIHWLPTREYKIVKDYRKEYGEFPDNLTVRLSAHKVDGPMPSEFGLPTSTVESKPDTYKDTHVCPAKYQGNACGDCRACWIKSVLNVAYPLH